MATISIGVSVGAIGAGFSDLARSARTFGSSMVSSLRSSAASAGSAISSSLSSAFTRSNSPTNTFTRSFRTRVTDAARLAGLSIASHLGSGFHNAGNRASQLGQTIVTGITSALSGAGSAISGALSSAIEASGKSPATLAAIAGLAAIIGPILGTAIGGAIVLGVGAGIAGLGLVVASKAPIVQKAFEKTKKSISAALTDAAKPFEPVLVRLAEKVDGFAKEAGPKLRGIFEDMAPHVEGFFTEMLDGIKEAAPELKPLTDAFNGLVDILTPTFKQTIIDIAKSLGDLGKEFQNPTTMKNFRDIVAGLLWLIPKAIDIITDLAEKARMIRDVFDTATGQIKRFVNWVKEIKNKTVKFSELGLKTITDKVINLVNKVKDFKNKTVHYAQTGANEVVRRVGSIIGKVKELKGKIINIGVSGVTTAIRWVQDLINTIRNLTGKSVSVTVDFFKGAGSALADLIPGLAHGGIVGSAAGGGPRGNSVLVGEHGPEIVDLAPGSRVHSNPDSRRMMNSGGTGGSGPIYVTLELDGKKIGEAMIDPLKYAIRGRGGNVQATLGKG